MKFNTQGYLEEYGIAIQQRRQELKMSQAELAYRAGISRNYLAMIERGVAEDPSFRIMVRLWQAAGIDIAGHIQEADVFSAATCPGCGCDLRITLTR